MSNKDEEEKWQKINQNNRSPEFKAGFKNISETINLQKTWSNPLIIRRLGGWTRKEFEES